MLYIMISSIKSRLDYAWTEKSLFLSESAPHLFLEDKNLKKIP